MIKRRSSSSAAKSPISSPGHRRSKAEVVSILKKLGLLEGIRPVLEAKGFIEKPEPEPPKEPQVPLEEIFKGVVAFVEVRSKGDDNSWVFRNRLVEGGGEVTSSITRKVTHVVFKEGRLSTYKKATQNGIPVINILWIVQSLKASRCLPIQDFLVEDPEPEMKAKAEERRKKKNSGFDRKTLLQPLERSVTRSEKKWSRLSCSMTQNNTLDSCGKSPSPETSPASKIKTSSKRKRLYSANDAGTDTSGVCKLKCSKVQHMPSILDVLNLNRRESTEEFKKSKTTVNTCKRLPDKRVSSTQGKIKSSSCKNDSQRDSVVRSRENHGATTDSDEPPKPGEDIDRKLQDVTGLASDAAGTLNGLDRNDSQKAEEKPAGSINTASDLEKQGKRDAVRLGDLKEGKPMLEDEAGHRQGVEVTVPSVLDSNAGRWRTHLLTNTTDRTSDKSELLTSKQTKTIGKEKESVSPAKSKRTSKGQPSTAVSTSSTENRTSRRCSTSKRSNDVSHGKSLPPRALPSLAITNCENSDRELVESVVQQLGGFELSKEVDSSTTHLICGPKKRTLGLLFAMAQGCWVLSLEWVYKSIEAGNWLEEEAFELGHYFPAVTLSRKARLTDRSDGQQGLFSSFGPFFVDPQCTMPADKLASLITAVGGKVVTCAGESDILVQDSPDQKQKSSEVTVSSKWVLDCISQHEVLTMF